MSFYWTNKSEKIYFLVFAMVIRLGHNKKWNHNYENKYTGNRFNFFSVRINISQEKHLFPGIHEYVLYERYFYKTSEIRINLIFSKHDSLKSKSSNPENI